MAYIVGSLKTAASAAATSYTVTLGEHVSGDLLLVCLSQDNGATAFTPDATSTTAGWVMLGTGAQSGACRGQWAYLIADSSSEVNPVFTSGATSAIWIGTCLVIRDAHATAPFGATPTSGTDFVRTDWNNVNSANSGSLTSAVNECLLIYSFCSDGSTQYIRGKIDQMVEIDKYAASQISHIIGFRQQQTAAAAPTVTMLSPVATEGGNGWVLAVRNKTGGALQPDVRFTATDWKYYGTWITQHDSVTWQSLSNFAASVNSIVCSSTAPTIDNTNLWPKPGTTYGTYTNLQSTENITLIESPGGSGGWVGGTHTVTSVDLTGKIVKIEVGSSTLSGSATVGSEGWLIGFSDGTNWVTYQLTTKAKTWSLNDPNSYWVAVGNATAYASSGTIASALSACTRVGILFHRISSSTGATSIQIKNLAYFSSAAITGGGASRPLTFTDLNSYTANWSHYRIIDIQSSAQIKVKTSIQIGDGTNATYFDGAAQSLEFPQAWAATTNNNWQMDWNSLSNQTSLSVYAKSGDTINLASGVAATDTAQNFSINASSAAAADATYSFVQSFVGWRDPIDNKGLNWSGTTFKECGTVTIAGGGNLTNCTISKTTSSTAPLTITANGTEISTSTIDCVMDTGASSAYHIALGASVTSLTLNGVTLSGTTSSAGSDNIYSALTSGELTITLDGTGTSLVAGDVTFAAGTAFATIASPTVNQKVTVSGITTGSRVQIYDTTSSTELFNGTATAGDTVVSGSTVVWTDPAAASADRAIRVRVAYVSGVTAKNFIETSGLTCGQTGATAEITYPVSPTADTTYDTNAVDGSAVTGITFTDAATDLVNINIGGGSVSLPTIYAAFVYWIFTAAGIDDDVAYISAPDPANYIMTSMKIRNTIATPLKVTGGYFYDSTGSVENCVDTAGSTGNIFPMPVHVVAYAVGSGVVTSQNISDIAAASATSTTTAVLAAAQTTPIHADLRKILGEAFQGDGSDANPWNPIP